MHRLFVAAAHLVPEIAGHLQLSRHRHLDLRHRQQIVEACLAGDFLGQEPQHVFARRAFGEPRKQRVALSRAGYFQLLVPIDEVVRAGRDIVDQGSNLAAHGFDVLALGAHNAGKRLHLVAPGFARQSRREGTRVEFGKLHMETLERGTEKFACVSGPRHVIIAHETIPLSRSEELRRSGRQPRRRPCRALRQKCPDRPLHNCIGRRKVAGPLARLRGKGRPP